MMLTMIGKRWVHTRAQSRRTELRRRLTRALAAASISLAILGSGSCAPAHGDAAEVDLARRDRDPGIWPIQGSDYALTRYSPLNKIDAANVAGLHVAWTFSTGQIHGHEGTPLVVNNTMYIVTPFPDQAYALDLTKGGALKWSHTPAPDPWAEGVACCDVVNRGWAYADGKLVYNLLDDRTIALDANDGHQIWETKLADVNRGITMTMSPLIVKDKVLVGNSGGEMGARGWIAALDLSSGKELWRAYSTGPDSDVKITANTHNFYSNDRGKDLGATSWPNDSWKHGGATVWGWISYDPELNLIYHGTSNPGPWNSDQRPGDNKWSSSIFARNPDNGEVKWAYQFTPHDMWDYDGVNENILITASIGGKARKALVHFDRNGFGYTMDRATGEILAVNPFVAQNWSSGIDLKTGVPGVVKDKETHQGRMTSDICPSTSGGKDEEPSAYSPRTGLVYVPAINVCMNKGEHQVQYIAGTPYMGSNFPAVPAPGGFKGALIAWDPKTAKEVWSVKDENYPVYSGVLTTGGDLVFYGTLDGWFRALDARTGRVLWQQQLGSGIIGGPMTYVGPDGKQYVAVLSGVGGVGGVYAKTPTAPPTGGMLYVFSL
ncbi:MAG TPA: PQQ-dependent dehydrogenase, methanol/ethanol family [Gemmatimonadaceae bacterium]